MTGREPDAFADILGGGGLEADEGCVAPDSIVTGGRARGGVMLAVSVACVLGGLAVASGAILVAALASASAPSVASTEQEAPAADLPPAPSADDGQPRTEGQQSVEPRAGVSELADAAWVERVAERAGIPPRAVAAYAGASVQVASESPGCGLGWNTLAGIGQVESEHGTIHGSQIGTDGVAVPGIIGIPLTGETTMQIRDTDGGVLDGDTVWDRAVGPMQFIPTTWEEWGSDGNGDGERDPQNIDDSALAAARYLCYAGGDLTRPGNWIAAVHAYNPTVEYNNRVAEAAAHYATF